MDVRRADVAGGDGSGGGSVCDVGSGRDGGSGGGRNHGV